MSACLGNQKLTLRYEMTWEIQMALLFQPNCNQTSVNLDAERGRVEVLGLNLTTPYLRRCAVASC